MNSKHFLEQTQETRVSLAKKIEIMLIANSWVTEPKEEIQYQYSINDKMDVLIKMKNPPNSKAYEHSKESENKVLKEFLKKEEVKG